VAKQYPSHFAVAAIPGLAAQAVSSTGRQWSPLLASLSLSHTLGTGAWGLYGPLDFLIHNKSGQSPELNFFFSNTIFGERSPPSSPYPLLLSSPGQFFGLWPASSKATLVWLFCCWRSWPAAALVHYSDLEPEFWAPPPSIYPSIHPAKLQTEETRLDPTLVDSNCGPVPVFVPLLLCCRCRPLQTPVRIWYTAAASWPGWNVGSGAQQQKKKTTHNSPVRRNEIGPDFCCWIVDGFADPTFVPLPGRQSIHCSFPTTAPSLTNIIDLTTTTTTTTTTTITT